MSDPTAIDQAVALLELQTELAFKHGLDLAQRTFWVNGEINEKMLKHVDACLNILENQSGKSVTMKISSMGGSSYDAVAIVSRMQSSKCKVHTEAHGCVMSAATLILAAGKKRSMSQYATFMFHESSYTVSGRHSENKAWVAQFDAEEQVWAEQMSKLSQKDQEYWAELGKHTDKFLTPSELLESGVIDRIF